MKKKKQLVAQNVEHLPKSRKVSWYAIPGYKPQKVLPSTRVKNLNPKNFRERTCSCQMACYIAKSKNTKSKPQTCRLKRERISTSKTANNCLLE